MPEIRRRFGVTENVVFATPRASINGAKALRRGTLSRESIEQALLWGRLSAEDAAQVRPTCGATRGVAMRTRTRHSGGSVEWSGCGSLAEAVGLARSG